jgi:hypothetical protein
MAKHEAAGVFVSALLHSSTATHFLHLSTKSYAEHKALGHFYEDILDLADKYAETYQGHYGLIPLTAYLDDFKVQKDAKVYIEGLLNFAKDTRAELPDDPDLQNIHDEIVGLIAATLYKLTHLS